MPDKTFSDVYLSAEQVVETHRTLENDHTVSEVELPGMVNVYLHIDGAKLLFTQYKAGKVLDALDAAAAAQKQANAANGAQTAQTTQAVELSAPSAEQPSGDPAAAEQPPGEPTAQG